jgi:hypothetical protein
LAPKAKVKAKSVVTPKNTAKPTGLQLSGAQWKAYNAAYTASASAGYRRLAIQSAAQSLRKSRLSAAASLQKKTAATHASAQTAAIALFAVKTSLRQAKLANQNAALVNRVTADFERHVQTAGRLQFAYQGEKVYTHTAVMRTLTTAQAVTAEEARFAQAAKSAKAAIASTTAPKQQTSAAAARAAAAVNAAAARAALAAAKATPAGRTAPRPLQRISAASYSGYWFGDPDGYDCVAAAIANSLSYSHRYHLEPSAYENLVQILGDAPDIDCALKTVAACSPIGQDAPSLINYGDAVSCLPGTVIGFRTERGDHAALYLGGGMIASWHEVLPLNRVLAGTEGIEESYSLTWAAL